LYEKENPAAWPILFKTEEVFSFVAVIETLRSSKGTSFTGACADVAMDKKKKMSV
jgi:hypothetical protein